MDDQNSGKNSRIDLRVAHLISTYGQDAGAIAFEHVNRYRGQENWQKEQQWMKIYSEILLFSDIHYARH